MIKITYRIIPNRFWHNCKTVKQTVAKALLLFALVLIAAHSFSQDFNEVIKIVASDRGNGDYFGNSVSISGNYAIVGALFETEDATGGNTLDKAGSVYLFERDGDGNWNEVQKIVASDRGARDWFGNSVSISGNYAIVGALNEDEDAVGGNSHSEAGSVYLFERDGDGKWNEIQKIVASDRISFAHFGNSVSISGNYAIVGANWEANDVAGGNYRMDAGASYLFERDVSGNWKEVQKIVASNRGAGDWFGNSVSISGNYAIVGAVLGDEDATGGNTLDKAGSVYLFERDVSGNWKEVQKIVASDRGAGDWFGNSVSISGNYAIVGAILGDEDATGGNTLRSAGSSYLFERDSSGYWKEVQKIVASDKGAEDGFGNSVSISGNYAIVGASNADEDATGGNTLDNVGSAYIFENTTGVGILENGFGGSLVVYPNPTSGKFSMDMGASYDGLTITITDLTGKLLYSKTHQQSQLLNLELNEPAGLYFIVVEAERKKAVIRLVK